MKYFGEYLVEKKIIKELELVQALIEQMKHTPLICEICLEKKIYSAIEILSIFKTQHEINSDFQSAAKTLNIWSSEIDIMIKKELEARREPLGRILNKKGLISTEVLTKALDEYFSVYKSENLSKIKQTDNAQDVKLEQKKIEAVETTSATDNIFVEIDFDLLKEMFNDERKNLIASVWKDVNNFDEIRTKSEIAENTAHLLKGVSVLNNLTTFVELLDSLEELFKEIQKENGKTITTEQAFCLCQSGNFIVEKIWSDVQDMIQVKASHMISISQYELYLKDIKDLTSQLKES